MSRSLSFPRFARPLAVTAVALAVAGALALPQTAHASAFQLHNNSAQALGRAYAGMAAAGGDCSAVVVNPASMSLLNTSCFQAGVLGINFSAQFNGHATDAMGRPISGGDGGDAGTTLPVPALYWIGKLSDNWRIGAAFTVPFGFGTKYDHDWVGRYNALKSKFQSLDATVSLSYDISDNFTLGASVIAQRTSATLTSAIDFNGVAVTLLRQTGNAPLIPLVGSLVPPGTDGFYKMKGKDWGYGWDLGALWKITPHDRLALNYHSKIDHTLTGTANFTVPDSVTALLPLFGSISGMTGTPFQRTAGSADFTTPATATLSYFHRGRNFGIGFDAAWTKWDEFKQLTINYANPAQPATVQTFDWRNTWFVSVGGDWYVNNHLTLRAGLALDTTPTYVGTRDPRVPDSTRHFVTVGMGYKVSDHIRMDVAYAHIFVNAAHVHSTNAATGDTLIGNFDDAGNLLSFEFQYRF